MIVMKSEVYNCDFGALAPAFRMIMVHALILMFKREITCSNYMASVREWVRIDIHCSLNEGLGITPAFGETSISKKKSN